MKKKIFLIVSLCMFALGLTACGTDPKKVDYNGVTYDELKTANETLASRLIQMSEEEIDAYIQSADEISVNLMSRWKEVKPEVGEYVGLGKFSVDKSGKTVTATQILDFKERDLTMTCVYNYLDMTVSDVTLDENYSLGEKMQKAAMNTLMGLGTVFLILILICFVISGFKVIPSLEQKFKAKKAPAAPAEAAPVQPEPEIVQQSPQTDDFELVAVIAAAIASDAGIPADGFVVRSIKRRNVK